MELAKERMKEHKFEIERSMEVLRDMEMDKMHDALMMAQASTPRPAVAPMPPGSFGRARDIRGRSGSEHSAVRSAAARRAAARADRRSALGGR